MKYDRAPFTCVTLAVYEPLSEDEADILYAAAKRAKIKESEKTEEPKQKIEEASTPEDIAVAKGNKFFEMLAKALDMVFTEDVDNFSDCDKDWKEFLECIKKTQLTITPSEEYNKKFEQAFKDFENAISKLS